MLLTSESARETSNMLASDDVGSRWRNKRRFVYGFLLWQHFERPPTIRADVDADVMITEDIVRARLGQIIWSNRRDFRGLSLARRVSCFGVCFSVNLRHIFRGFISPYSSFFFTRFREMSCCVFFGVFFSSIFLWARNRILCAAACAISNWVSAQHVNIFVRRNWENARASMIFNLGLTQVVIVFAIALMVMNRALTSVAVEYLQKRKRWLSNEGSVEYFENP